MTTEPKAAKRGLTGIGRIVACIAVVLVGAFAVVKANRSATAAPAAEASSPPFKCPVQATGNGVAIPDIDPRCL